MNTLSFGEILWDIINGHSYIGGAPFNLAVHLAKMGCRSTLISSVGKDKLGKRALEEALQRQVNTEFIQCHPFLPTGVVNVKLDSKGHPAYRIIENVAWDHIELNKNSIFNLSKINWEIFCFGTLAQRTPENRKMLNHLLFSIKPRHVFYDVNLRQHYYRKEWVEKSLCQSTIVKLNDREASMLSELLFQQKLKQKDFIKNLAEKYDLSIVCVTHGKEGVSIYHQDSLERVPGINGPVTDTVGAGDGFSAAFLFSYLCGSSIFESAEFGEIVANFVVSQSGAVPKYPKWLEKEINNLHRIKKSI